MPRNFKELQRKMAPGPRARSDAKANAMLKDMALDELRAARAMTQEELGQKLGLKQAAISRMERRTDVYVSTLAKFVEAIGGQLEIRVVFPDRTIRQPVQRCARVAWGTPYAQPITRVCGLLGMGCAAMPPKPASWYIFSKLVESVRIPGRGARQHGQAEGRGDGRRNAVFIGHEFQRSGAAAGPQGRTHFPQQPDARGRVEMVQEIREQDDVVRSAILDVERATRQQMVAVLHARLTRVAARHLQHSGPIDCGDVRFRMELGHLDAEQAVAGGDI